MRTLAILLLTLVSFSALAQNNRESEGEWSIIGGGALMVTVVEGATMKVIPSSVINVYKNDLLLKTGITDSSGIYTIENIHPGSYKISCDHKIQKKSMIKNVVIVENKATIIEFKMN